MMNERHTKIIVTLGPATNTEQDLRKMKDKQVILDYVKTTAATDKVLAKLRGVPPEQNDSERE